MDSPCLVLVTGGPGSGKTTLIEALADRGFARTEEAGRAIIRDQQARGGSALPWADRAAFARAMLAWDVDAYRRARRLRPPVICDRGMPDVVGYLRLCGLPIPAIADRAATRLRYRPRVFIAPPWREIVGQDTERRQDWPEAERTYRAMIVTYRDYGYALVELPKLSVEERVRFVTARL